MFCYHSYYPLLAQTIVSTFKVDNKPSRIVVNPNTDLIYIVSREGNNISVVDSLTNKVITNIEVGNMPNGIAVNPITNTIYVGDSNGDISVIEGVTNQVIETIETVLASIPNPTIPTSTPIFPTEIIIRTTAQPTMISPDLITVNPDTNLIYVGNSNSLIIGVIDGSTNTVIDSVSLIFNNMAFMPKGIGVNSLTNIIYVPTEFSSKAFFIIDGADNRIVGTSSMDGIPSGIVMSEKIDRIYVSQNSINIASVIDSLTNQIIATIGTEITSSVVRNIGINSEINHIYITDQNNRNLQMIDSLTNETIKVALPNISPCNIAVNPNNNLIYVLDEFSEIITVIEDNADSIPSPSKTLKADFVANETINAVPLIVQFTNLSTGDVTDLFWGFGDGEISSESFTADSLSVTIGLK